VGNYVSKPCVLQLGIPSSAEITLVQSHTVAMRLVEHSGPLKSAVVGLNAGNLRTRAIEMRGKFQHFSQPTLTRSVTL